MACRAFPDAPPAAVARFACWLVWTFWFDDERDEGHLGWAPDRLDDLFGRLTATLACGRPAAGARPLEVALAGLWELTADAMSPAWQQRFRHHFALQWAATRTESVNRATGHVPTLTEYPALRRDSNGTAGLVDLIEPTLGVEVPAALTASPGWVGVVDALNDVVTWTNDLASLRKEAAHDDVHNHVVVAAVALGIDVGHAARWVAERVVERLADLRAHADTVERAAPDVVDVLLRTPRAHLDWLLESHRYA